MENQDSIYLYSNDQKPLYTKVLGELESRNCPHTHTVYALMDVEESEVPQNMVDHVSTCKECQKTVLLGQNVNNRINTLIPVFQNNSLNTLVESNRKMFMRSEFGVLSKSKNTALGVFKTASENLLDIFSVIFSVKMGITYVAAIFLALFLNWAF